MRVVAVVLAAGASTRMGRPKQLLPFGTSTMLGSVVDALLASRVDRVIVVVGHHADAVRASLLDRAVHFVVNPEPEHGMLSSVQCGITAAPNVDAYLIALGDQPRLTPEVVDELISAAERSADSIVLPAYCGKRGHPLLIRSSLRDEALALPLTVGLNALVAAHGEDVEELPVDLPEVLHDIDTPEDYERFGRPPS